MIMLEIINLQTHGFKCKRLTIYGMFNVKVSKKSVLQKIRTWLTDKFVTGIEKE